MPRPTRSPRLPLLALALTLAWPLSAQAMLVTFAWDPASQSVAGSATSATVTLEALQTDDADAAAITLGFAFSGAITGVELLSYGSAVSVADSFFGDLSGTTGIIAVAPASPGSFGQNVDFEVATLTLLLDFGLDAEGTISLVDLTSVAGAPALDMSAAAIPSDISAVHLLTPEPSTALLLLAGLAGLGATERERRTG